MQSLTRYTVQSCKWEVTEMEGFNIKNSGFQMKALFREGGLNGTFKSTCQGVTSRNFTL